MPAGSGGSAGGASGIAGSGGMTSSGGMGLAGMTASGAITGSGGTTGSGGAGSGGGTNTGGTTTTNCVPPNPPSAKDSLMVDMGVVSGPPTYRASGFIYGISPDGSQPPLTTLSDIKVQHLRAGGAQIGCPNGGFMNGQYAARWNAVKAYHDKAKAIGATLLVLVHDIWGADAVCKVPRWPGNGGDWTEYTSFMTQLITDMKANGMTGPDVRWELWNEPDYSGFWGGTQAQWLEMWKRGYQQVRSAIPSAIIEGPSLASGIGGWFNAFLDYTKANNVVPDYMGWHEAGGGGDPLNDAKNARLASSSRGMNASNLDISEYGSGSEQNPGHSAWFIARLERADVDGLRSNWGGGSGLYSTMAGLVTSSWQPNAQWWIYKRYADQTGLRTSVTPGAQVDAVAYQDANQARAIIVAGNRGGTTGPVNVVIKNMPAWLERGGSTKVVLEKLPDGAGAVSAPTVVSDAAATVTCHTLAIAIDWSNAKDGYAISLTAPLIDPPVVVADNVWPLAQYTTCVNAGVEDAYKGIVPGTLYNDPDYVFPASCGVSAGASSSITVRSLGSAANTIWFAPSGTNQFVEGANMTKASGSTTSLTAPASAGTYKLFVVDAQGTKLGESAATLRVR